MPFLLPQVWVGWYKRNFIESLKIGRPLKKVQNALVALLLFIWPTNRKISRYPQKYSRLTVIRSKQPYAKCNLQDNERRGTKKHRGYVARCSSEELAAGLPSNLILKYINKTNWCKGICYWSCANAHYQAQEIQWDKRNLTRFSTNFGFEDFSRMLPHATENAVTGHMRPAGL